MRERKDETGPFADPERFDQLYERWSDPIYRYIVRLIGPGPHAEDLFQDTWMKAIEHQNELRDHDKFASWIFRIARNLAFNLHRERRRKAQVWIFSNLEAEGERWTEDRPARTRESSADPREQAIGRERAKILQEILSGFEPQIQEMLQLRYFEHLKLAEIARVLDVPLGTVCTRVHRALKAIRIEMRSRGLESLGAL